MPSERRRCKAGSGWHGAALPGCVPG